MKPNYGGFSNRRAIASWVDKYGRERVTWHYTAEKEVELPMAEWRVDGTPSIGWRVVKYLPDGFEVGNIWYWGLTQTEAIAICDALNALHGGGTR